MKHNFPIQRFEIKLACTFRPKDVFKTKKYITKKRKIQRQAEKPSEKVRRTMTWVDSEKSLMIFL